MKEEMIINTQLARRTSVLKNVLFTFLLILIISAVVILSLIQFRTPEVIRESELIDHFSAERAMNYLKDFAVAPHPIGSEEHNRVREYLVAKLMEFGVSPEIQAMEGVLPAWGEPFDGPISNIVARIPGTDSSITIMLVAHYDTADDSPGAADDGAGVAALLETARILSQNKMLKNNVILLLTDGEEIGLLGAKGFVEQHPWADEVDLVLNFEARGSAGPSVMFETNEENSLLISEFVKGASNPVAHSFTYDLYKKLGNDTDLSIFKRAGMYGLNFGFFANSHNYHSSADNIENLSLGSLQHHGDNMLSLVKHFGNLDSPKKKEGNSIFFNLFGKKIITYSEKLVTPIMVICILLFIMTFINGYIRRKITFISMSAGSIIFGILLCFVFYAGELVSKVFTSIFQEQMILIEKEITISNPIFAGFIFIFFALIALIYQAVAKKVNIASLTMGAYLCWLLIVVYFSIFFKASSYIFAWPFIFGMIGLNVLMRLKNESSLKGYSITAGFAIPAILIAVPALYLIYILFTLEAMGILLALTTLLGVFVLPILSGLKIKAFGFPIGLFLIGLLILLGTTTILL